jgi:poly(A) polymerase
MFKIEGIPPALETLLAREQGNAPIWIVGGAIRDMLLQRGSHDVDFTTSGDALALARLAADRLDAQVYILDGERRSGRVLYQAPDGSRQTFDFAQLRGDSIESDLRSRDFTINAMGIRIGDVETIIDPCGGAQHLHDRLVDLCAEDAIKSDPVRGLRAIRIASELSFRLSPRTIAAIRALPFLDPISAERLRDELFNTLALANPVPAVQLLNHFNLLPLVFTGDVSSFTNNGWRLDDGEAIRVALQGLRHMVSILNLLAPNTNLESAAQATLGLLTWRLGRFRFSLHRYLCAEASFGRNQRELLLFTFLLHSLIATEESSTSVPESRVSDFHLVYEQIGNRFRLSRDEIEWALRWEKALVLLAQAIDPLTSLDVWSYRYFRITRDSGVGASLSMLAFTLAQQIEPPTADYWAARVEVTYNLLEAWFEKHEMIVTPQRLIDGDDVMEILNNKPGPEVGRILEQVREGQVVGELLTREDAIRFITREFGGQSV